MLIRSEWMTAVGTNQRTRSVPLRVVGRIEALGIPRRADLCSEPLLSGFVV